jgi:SH3 domain
VDKCEYKAHDDDDDDDDSYSIDDSVDTVSSDDADRARRCATFLRSVTRQFGSGDVYALYDYVPVRDDELSFLSGDRLTVLRRGDDQVPQF